MKCKFPVVMYRGDDGSVGHVEHKVKNVKYKFYRPCGLCMDCRIKKAQDWSIRMTHEASLHEESSFITLTYEDKYLPENGSLKYGDVRGFLNRLRSHLKYKNSDKKIQFYRVGEYGEGLSRPHYHLIVFGYDFREKIEYHGEENEFKKSGQKEDRTYYKSTFATNCWGKGHVDIGRVDYSTCYYVAKYVTKKLFGQDANNYKKINEYGEYVNIDKEKASMSKKTPIGERWIKKYYKDVYPDDVVSLGGKKLQTPTYYDKWLEKNQPKLWEEVKRKREDNQRFEEPNIRELYNGHFIKIEKQKKFLRDGAEPNYEIDKRMLERTKNLMEEEHFKKIRQGL